MKPFIRNTLFGGAGSSNAAGDVGLLILRVSAGLLLAVLHGAGKVYRDGTFGPQPGFVRGVEALGFPMPTFFAWSAGIAEFLGGLLLAAGLLTRPAACLIAITMAVAAFGQHAGDPWEVKEKALLYLSVAILFIVTGPGRFSADRLIRRH